MHAQPGSFSMRSDELGPSSSRSGPVWTREKCCSDRRQLHRAGGRGVLACTECALDLVAPGRIPMERIFLGARLALWSGASTRTGKVRSLSDHQTSDLRGACKRHRAMPYWPHGRSAAPEEGLHRCGRDTPARWRTAVTARVFGGGRERVQRPGCRRTVPAVGGNDVYSRRSADPRLPGNSGAAWSGIATGRLIPAHSGEVGRWDQNADRHHGGWEQHSLSYRQQPVGWWGPSVDAQHAQDHRIGRDKRFRHTMRRRWAGRRFRTRTTDVTIAAALEG